MSQTVPENLGQNTTRQQEPERQTRVQTPLFPLQDTSVPGDPRRQIAVNYRLNLEQTNTAVRYIERYAVDLITPDETASNVELVVK